MLVYGDRSRVASVGEIRAAVLSALASAENMAPGIARHATLVSAFIALGEWAQGVADVAFEEEGADRASPAERSGMAALTALAKTVDNSWRSRGGAGFVPRA